MAWRMSFTALNMIAREVLHRCTEPVHFLPERRHAGLAPRAEQTSDDATGTTIDPTGAVIAERYPTDPTSALLALVDGIVFLRPQAEPPLSIRCPKTRLAPRRTQAAPSVVAAEPGFVSAGPALRAGD